MTTPLIATTPAAQLLGNQHLWELDGDSPLHNAQPYSNFREADLVAQLKAWWQPPLQRYLASHLPRPSDVRRLRLDRRTASIVRMRFARSMTLAPERFVSPTPHLTELGAAEVAEDEVGYSPQGSTHSGSVAHPPSGGRYRTDSATVEYGELLVGPRGAATHGAESDDERKLQAFPTGLDSGAEGAMPSYALDTEAYAAAWTADSAGWAAPPGATPFDARDGVAGGATHPAPRAGSTHWLHDPGSLTSFDEGASVQGMARQQGCIMGTCIPLSSHFSHAPLSRQCWARPSWCPPCSQRTAARRGHRVEGGRGSSLGGVPPPAARRPPGQRSHPTASTGSETTCASAWPRRRRGRRRSEWAGTEWR